MVTGRWLSTVWEKSEQSPDVSSDAHSLSTAPKAYISWISESWKDAKVNSLNVRVSLMAEVSSSI